MEDEKLAKYPAQEGESQQAQNYRPCPHLADEP